MKDQKPNHYSEEFKWKVVQEVLAGKLSKEEARRIYGIKSNCAILYWIRKYSGISNFRLGGQPVESIEILSTMKEISGKDKRIAELEEELLRERTRADLWQAMVEVAEKELNVDIRKKFGAK